MTTTPGFLTLDAAAQDLLAVVNIGKPGENAWSQRNPRLEYHEVVTTV